MTQSQSQDCFTAPVASGSMTQTLAISVDYALSSYGAFQPYHAADVALARLDTHWKLEIMPEGEESEKSNNSDGSLVPAQVLLAWAIVAKSHSGTDSVMVLGPNVQRKPQSSILVDGAALVVDHLNAIRSQLDGLATPSPATTPVADQPYRHPLALRYNYSEDTASSENGLQIEGDRDATIPANAPLLITCSGHLGCWSVELRADLSVIDQSLLPILSRNFQSAFDQLRSCASSEVTLRDISLSGTEDMGMLQMLGGRPAVPARSRVHDLIVQRAQSQPDAEASVSWDIKLTYAELDRFSDILAFHLVSLGLQVGSTVATCLDKSGWVPAVYLAVLKAGGAFAPLSSALSAERLTPVVAKLSPNIIIASSPNLSKFVGLAAHVLDVAEIFTDPEATEIQQPFEVPVTTNHPACVISTSDGLEAATLLVLDHVAVCTSIATNSDIHGFSPATRTLQFAPYDSRTSVADVLFTLAEGGCVCTPSEHERLTGIADVCRRMKPTLACLTPSLAAILDPDDLPGVETIVLAGEPLTTNSVKRWASATNVISAYAPAAALGYACSTTSLTSDSFPRNIGWPRGCAAWLMDPEDPTRLAPPGAAGQLLLESPFLGQKYLCGDEASASAFISRPDCLPLPLFSPKPTGDTRCFLTDDLVRFDIRDGTLQPLGRKSPQGQFLQFLNEAEDITLQSSETIRQAIAVVPSRGGYANRLVVLVSFVSESRTDSLVILDHAKDHQLSEALFTIRQHVSGRLPGHLDPVWLAVAGVPLTPQDTLNRPAVLAWVESADDSFSGDLHDSRSPTSTVGETPTLTEAGSTPLVLMPASASQTSLETSAIGISPQAADERFTLLGLSPEKLSQLEALLHTLGPVEDCYPCCPVQEGILVSQVKAPGTYNILVIWDLVAQADPVIAANVSLTSLRAAWERVVQRHAPLRSTFVESVRDGSLFDQVVLSSPSVDVVEVPWLEEILDADDLLQLTAARWEKGKPQHRLGLCKAADGRLRCQLLISHAVIDGLSVQTLGHDLERSLNGVLPDNPQPDLQHRYVRELQQAPKEDAREFWRAYLDGLSGCLLPRLTDWTIPQSPGRVTTKRRSIPDVKRLRRFCQEQGITLFSLTQAAWAMVLRAYTLSDDVCFAFMATDRHLLGDDADDAVGFFINLMLCRVRLQGSTPIPDVLTSLRRDFVSSLPYQHYSLAEIAHEHRIPASQLFNTSMTFYSVDDDAESHRGGVQLRRVADQDVAEVFPPPKTRTIAPVLFWKHIY